MARRTGFVAAMAQAQREQARRQTAYARQVAAVQRQHERAVAAAQRAQVASARQAARDYAEARADQAEANNEQLEATLEALDGLLAATLSVDDFIDVRRLKRTEELGPFAARSAGNPLPAPQWEQFAPPEPAGIGKVFGKGKHEAALAQAKQQYEAAHYAYQVAEHQRLEALNQAAAEHEKRRAQERVEVAAYNDEIERFAQDVEADKAEALTQYAEMVLQASLYPAGFSAAFRLAWVPDSHQLVVEYDLPSLDVVPAVKAYRYVKARDEITTSPRPAAQIKSQYASVVAQVALRTVHELFEADRWSHVETIVFNGMVDGIDPKTGKAVRPCLITLRTTRDTFLDLDLAHVEPQACLRGLNAGVSRSPSELTPVRPVLEFDMVDPRFVAETNVLDELDSRPNLMELRPTEFEGLISNLFAKMGLETRQTRPSRDGGVDCVAYDPRPILGGKVVIQAKRYKNTVGVSAVRDLFGTLQNEGASKGILVATSGYGQASYDFASGKPIELIDGANLLYLLSEHAGVEARIVPPEDWVDPHPDEGESA